MNRKTDLKEIEKRLADALQSVQPTDDFVAHVKHRFREPSISLRARQDAASQFMLLGSGVLFAFMGMLMLTRVLFYLTGWSKHQTAH